MGAEAHVSGGVGSDGVDVSVDLGASLGLGASVSLDVHVSWDDLNPINQVEGLVDAAGSVVDAAGSVVDAAGSAVDALDGLFQDSGAAAPAPAPATPILGRGSRAAGPRRARASRDGGRAPRARSRARCLRPAPPAPLSPAALPPQLDQLLRHPPTVPIDPGPPDMGGVLDWLLPFSR